MWHASVRAVPVLAVCRQGRGSRQPACRLRGLGLALAEERSPGKNRASPFSQASKKLVAATGQQCLPLSIDVRQPQTIVAAVEEALREFKRIDILVNGELPARGGEGRHRLCRGGAQCGGCVCRVRLLLRSGSGWAGAGARR